MTAPAAPGSIVVGTDLGPASEPALEEAAAWALRTGAPLKVVHVAANLSQVDHERAANALRPRALGKMDELGVRAEIALREGSAHAELIRYADEVKARLLIVGVPHKQGLGRLLGSTVDRVTRYAHCPVLVARPSPAKGPVLVATDFSPYAQGALSAAAAEAKARGVSLHVVHALFEPESALSALGPAVISVPVLSSEQRGEVRDSANQTLSTLLEGAGVAGTTEIVFGEPGQAIGAAAERAGASLVVVATHGRTGLVRIALGSVAEHVARHSPCSVLVERLPPEA